MARKKSDDRVKRALLLFFVALSVALIIGIYVTGLSGGDEPGRGFERGVPVGWVESGDGRLEIGDWHVPGTTLDTGHMVLDI